MQALSCFLAAAGGAHAQAWLGNPSCSALKLPAPCCTGPATGTCLPPLTDTPEYTTNEIYDLISTDPVEGTALAASFGGLGLDNQPHQQLANRTAFLNNHRLTDESNITTLQSFAAGFVGLMAQNGYMEVNINDVNKGLIPYFLEWGLRELRHERDAGSLRAVFVSRMRFRTPAEIILPVVVTANNATFFDTDDDAVQISNQFFLTASQFWVYNNRPGSAADGRLARLYVDRQDRLLVTRWRRR